MAIPFSVQKFESLKVTTMTLIFELHGEVNLPLIFTVLPITRLELSEPKRQTKNFKLPDVQLPGQIFSIRYGGLTRGITRSVGSQFKNCITLDIGTSDRIVSIKLSRQKIQMCGPKSVEIGKEAASYIVQHINFVQEMLNYLHSHPYMTEKVVSWLIMKSVGPMVEKQVCNYIDAKNVRLKIFSVTQEASIVRPTDIPSELDPLIVNFMIQQCDEFVYHSDLVATLQEILTSRYAVGYGATLLLGEPQKAMVNYNYNLGFSVDRAALALSMTDMDDFIADYDNLLQHSVRIYLPYQSEQQTKRRNKTKRHTFMVSRSGSVTQSGPNDELMREAYYRFMSTISRIYHIIKVDEAK